MDIEDCATIFATGVIGSSPCKKHDIPGKIVPLIRGALLHFYDYNQRILPWRQSSMVAFIF